MIAVWFSQELQAAKTDLEAKITSVHDTAAADLATAQKQLEDTISTEVGAVSEKVNI